MIHSNHAVAFALVALNAASVIAFPMDNEHVQRTVPSPAGAPNNITPSALPTTTTSSVGTGTSHMPTTTITGLAIATPCAPGQPPTLELFRSRSLLPSTMSRGYANHTTSSGASGGGNLTRVMPRAVAPSDDVVPSSTTATSLTSTTAQAIPTGPPSTNTTGSAASPTVARPLPRPSSANTTATKPSSTQSATASPTPPPSTWIPFPQDTLPGAPGPPGSVTTTVAPSTTKQLKALDHGVQGTPTPLVLKNVASTAPAATTQTHTGVDGKPTVTVFIPSTATYCYGTYPESTGTPQSQAGSGGRAAPTTTSHVPPSRTTNGPPDPKLAARATEQSKRQLALDQLD